MITKQLLYLQTAYYLLPPLVISPKICKGRNMKHLKLSLLLLTLLLGSNCREYTVQPTLPGSMVGTVIQEGSDIAISNATISTTPPTSLLLTDDLGRFALKNIAPGTYTIRAEKDDFISKFESITVLEEKTANVIIKLPLDTLSNIAPTIPLLLAPRDNSIGRSIDLTLSWQAEDKDGNEELRYDVLLCEDKQTNCEKIAIDIAENTFELEDLKYNTVYFWQVIAKDQTTAVYGGIWRFKTVRFPNHPFVYCKLKNGQYDIYSTDGVGDEFRLTYGPSSSYRPRISPNRQMIAFINNSGVAPHLYVVNRDGTNLKQVTKEVPIGGFNNMDLDFSWSSGSNQLLYGNNAKLYRIKINGTNLTEIAQAPEGFTFSEVDWFFGLVGNKIAARVTGQTVYESSIFIIDVFGNYLQEIFTDIPGRTGGLQFSPDGKFILYTHDVSGHEDINSQQLNTHIFIKNLENGVTFDLSNISKAAGTNDLDPRFSPDGTKVIFVNTDNQEGSIRNIMTMDIDGTNRTVLFEDAEMVDWQ